MDRRLGSVPDRHQRGHRLHPRPARPGGDRPHLDGVVLTLFAFPVCRVVVAPRVRPLGAVAFALAVPPTVAVQLLAGRTRTELLTHGA